MLHKLKTKLIISQRSAITANIAHALVHNIVHPLDKFRQAHTCSTIFKSFIEQYLSFKCLFNSEIFVVKVKNF